ncbi:MULTISPECIES: restriction endonuclease [unclassified Halobacteriovorax]|uniref:restriction endonuclease n=1 Tax=unclassified Halobacteriovorax TaxID=2639665 RepID=UPI002FF0FE97
MSARKNKKLKYLIRKVNRTYEEFDKKKFAKSLKAAGVSKEDTEDIVNEVYQGLEPLSSTTKIHQQTYRALKKISKVDAANYNIKRAIYKLGPTGYPFEVLCAEMLKAKGYETQVSVLKKGVNVLHEVDVVAERADGDIYCECKFHNRKYYKNDVKIPLYVHSRYLDIKEANPELNFQYALMSNTQFSEDAIAYANGVGLLLYSMNYPKKNTFCQLIQKYRIYPITALSTLRAREKKALLQRNIVVIKHLERKHLEKLGLSKNEINKVMREVKLLLKRD